MFGGDYINIFDYITSQQLSSIIEIIKNRCDQFNKFDSLFYEPYTTMRKKHSLTLAVISGFSPDDMDIKGLKTQNVYYGLNDKMAQPEIHCKNAVIQIYSDGSKLNNYIIKTRCEEYNQDTQKPIFFIVRFTANKKNVLKSIDICFLDSEANITETINVYTHNQ